MKNAVRWGIWGTGTIAHMVANDFPLVDGALLHAVASRTVERAKEFALEHGAAKWYEGLNSLLQDPEVDVVYVATPNHCHLEDCLACIRAGKAVLCEKPLALNLAQAEVIADAARRHKVFCMEAMWTRFIPSVIEAKRRIDAGEIGLPRLIQGNFAYPAQRESESRLFDIKQGGGALLDRGVYLISLAQYLMGVPELVRGTMVLGPTGVDEQSSCQLVFAGGALADLATSLLVQGRNDFLISGEHGWLRLCKPFYCAHRLEVRSYGSQQTMQRESTQSPGGVRRIVQRVRQSHTVKLLRRRFGLLLEVLDRPRSRSFPFAGNGYQFELMEVNRCIRDGRTESSTMSLNDSLEVLKTMDALRSQWGLLYPQEGLEFQVKADRVSA
ncbi:MAG: Gfo/Idh/MocA family oxidoreductase [Acidobacteriota bacterium]|nr:Gfo/Idh/MocA family oxidoreductase [Acidobacteriota bacterium]